MFPLSEGNFDYDIIHHMGEETVTYSPPLESQGRVNLDTGLVPHVASKVNFLRILPGVKFNEYINSK